MSDLAGRTILLTGATGGIGLEAACVLAARGASLVLVGRDAERTRRAVERVAGHAQPGRVSSHLCDFRSQAQVRRLAAEVRARHDRLDVLVNNAGTVFAAREETEDGVEATFAVNHLGYFLLTRLLVDLVEKGENPRIVNVASEAHRGAAIDFDDLSTRRGWNTVRAYGRSKLANVLFTRALAQRLEGRVSVNCLHPGVVDTGIWSHSPALVRPALQLLSRLFFISAEKGGRTIVQLAADVEGGSVTGAYFKNLRQSTPSRAARDDAAAERLWRESERLVGLA